MEESKIITSMMEESRVFDPPAELSQKAYIKNLDEYKEIYRRSIDDPETFWGDMAEPDLFKHFPADWRTTNTKSQKCTPGLCRNVFAGQGLPR